MKTISLEILEKTQLPADQARAILQVMELEINARVEAFATKGDLKDVVKDAVHALELRMEGLESRLTRWVFTCMLGQSAVIAAAVYFALTHLR
jgi:hypothetical protein